MATDLYPHGVHVVGEGQSEKLIVEWIVEALVGPRLLSQIAFYDLGGAGAAARVEPLAQALGGYAIRCAVIVDREGKMAEYLMPAINDGRLPADNVLLFDDSVEASNATSDELVAIAQAIGREVEEPVGVTAEDLDAYHAERLSRLGGAATPGTADSLIRLVGRVSEGRLPISKLEFADRLGRLIAEELVAADDDPLQAIMKRRPIVRFVIERIIDPLNQPVPVGRRI